MVKNTHIELLIIILLLCYHYFFLFQNSAHCTSRVSRANTACDNDSQLTVYTNFSQLIEKKIFFFIIVYRSKHFYNGAKKKKKKSK